MSVETGMTAVKAGDRSAEKSINGLGSILPPTEKTECIVMIRCKAVELLDEHPLHDRNCPKPLFGLSLGDLQGTIRLLNSLINYHSININFRLNIFHDWAVMMCGAAVLLLS